MRLYQPCFRKNHALDLRFLGPFDILHHDNTIILFRQVLRFPARDDRLDDSKRRVTARFRCFRGFHISQELVE